MKKHTTKKILTSIALIIGLAAITSSVEAVSRDGAIQQAAQWEQSPWYGWYETSNYPDILHVEHGWQRLVYKDDNSITVYDYGMESYFFTALELYPWIYKFGDNAGWILYFTGGRPQERWFKMANQNVYAEASELNRLEQSQQSQRIAE